jgi:uncharacterized MAPEG superfamily protein
MSVELTLLLWSAALAFLQMLVAVSGASLKLGLRTLSGNREQMPEIAGWPGRARRAPLNMLENLILFAILVLVGHAMGKSNGTTVVGAEIFFWMRVIYVPVYLFGVPWLRTGVWTISVVGLVMMFTQLV